MQPKLLKPTNPTNILIEQTALNLAATFYEAGRNTGMTSKHKTPQAFAKANLERFIPKAVDILLDILGKPDTPDVMKQAIHEALIERHNDPTLVEYLPNVDVLQLIKEHDEREQRKVVVIETAKQQAKTVLHKRVN